MLTIKTARRDDLKTLQKLNEEVFADNCKYDPDLEKDWSKSKACRKYFRDLLNNPKAICLIALVDNKPVGFITAVAKEFRYYLSKYIEIENLGILPNYRSKGIGTKLMSKFFKIAKKMNLKKAYLISYFKNSRAIEFYENRGFKKIDIGLEKNV